MKIIRILMLFYCYSLVSSAYAQETNISFQYDDSGNCTVKYKTIVLPATRSAESEEETEAPMIDIFGESEIRIYPNPTQGQLRIEWTGEFPETTPQIILSDMNGRYLQTAGMTGPDYLLDLSAYPQGIYILRIRTSEMYRDFKIIKQ